MRETIDSLLERVNLSVYAVLRRGDFDAIVGPGRLAISEGPLIAKKVRTCITVVLKPNMIEQGGVKAMLHYNGEEEPLEVFMRETNKRIPAGVAILAGAASYLGCGARNLEAVVATLGAAGIQIVSQDIGGHFERTVVADSAGIFIRRRLYSPLSAVNAGLYRNYEEIDGTVETIWL
mgnify:CR=1 FL=1